jgi:hypothetical protein
VQIVIAEHRKRFMHFTRDGTQPGKCFFFGQMV